MKKDTHNPSVKSKRRKKYNSPELVHYGNLSKLTASTSAGTIADGGTQPNKNVTMN